MNRAAFSPVLGLWWVCAGDGRTLAAETASADKRPNILFASPTTGRGPMPGRTATRWSTPTFDRVAREGVLFRNAFVAAPTCTASRGGILTGQAIHRLEGGQPLEHPAGQVPGVSRSARSVGLRRRTDAKRLGARHPRRDRAHATTRPDRVQAFDEFLKTVPADKPFCFWFGSNDPHRPYEPGSGKASGIEVDVSVPPYLPDTPTVRSDLLDYYFEVQRFDREVGELLELLRQAGRFDNTIVVMTGDNGMPFPAQGDALRGRHPRAAGRALAGPSARRAHGRRLRQLHRLCPTFLEAAGLKPLPEMTGRSFLDVLRSDKSGRVDPRAITCSPNASDTARAASATRAIRAALRTGGVHVHPQPPAGVGAPRRRGTTRTPSVPSATPTVRLPRARCSTVGPKRRSRASSGCASDSGRPRSFTWSETTRGICATWLASRSTPRPGQAPRPKWTSGCAPRRTPRPGRNRFLGQVHLREGSHKGRREGKAGRYAVRWQSRAFLVLHAAGLG